MAHSSKGPPDQAKHFKHDDHAHAAHQADAAHHPAPKPSLEPEAEGSDAAGKSVHPVSTTPKAPSKGQ